MVTWAHLYSCLAADKTGGEAPGWRDWMLAFTSVTT